MNILGANIRRLRTYLGDSQAAFGARFGLNRGQIASYEAEEKYSAPPFEAVLTIVDNFNIDLRTFISDPTFDGKPGEEGKANGKLKGKPSAEVQNEKNKKSETPTSAVTRASEGPTPYSTGSNIQVRSVVVAVDQDNEERITMVEELVFAGYQRGYADPSFVATLPTFTLPGFSGRSYRAFEVRGDSMVPTLQPRDIIVCSFVEDWRFLRNDYVYVIVSPDAGLVVKRVANRIDTRGRGHIVCTSDNSSEHPPFQLRATAEYISELWQVELRLTKSLAPPPPAPELVTRVTVLEMQLQDVMERLQTPQTAHSSAFIED